MWLLQRLWVSRKGRAEQVALAKPQPGASPPSSPAGSVSERGWARTFGALASSHFRTLWFGTLFSMAGQQMNMVAQPWLAYQLSSHSALAVGIVAGSRGLPMVLLFPLGGVVADRWDKRKVLIVTQTSLAVLGLTTAVLVALHVIQLWHLIAISVTQGLIGPFNIPTRQAYIPELVRGERVANALALDGTSQSLNRVVAPSIAGVLLAWRPDATFFAVAAVFCSAMLTIFQLPSSGPATTSSKGPLAEIQAGVRHVRERPGLLTLVGMTFALSMLAVPYQFFLPVFQDRVLHVGEERLGLMYTAVGIGALTGSLLAANLASHPRKGLFQMLSGIALGISLVLFALSTVYGVSLAFLVLVGFTSQVYTIINRVLLMINTDRAFYGRIMSIYFMTLSLVSPALLPIGALVDLVGAPKTIAAAGALHALFVATIALVYPRLWRRPRDSPRSAEDPPGFR